MATKSTKKPVRKTNTRAKKPAVKKTVAAKTSKKVTSVKATAKTVVKSTDKLKNLRIWHAVAGMVHAVQAVLVVVLDKSNQSVAVSTSHLTADSLSDGKPLVLASRQLFDVRVAWLIAAFLGVAALYHILIATVLNNRYQKVVTNEVNRLRWAEFVIGSGLVLVTFALLLGIRDITSLLLIFVVSEGVHLMAYLLETNPKAYPYLPIKLGAKFIATIGLVIGWFVFATNHYGSANISSYLYWLMGVGVVLFGLFTWTGWLHHQKRGQFADFIYTEKAYLVLSLVAKAAFAWIVFFAILD